MSRERFITQQGKGRPVWKVAEGLLAFPWQDFPAVPTLVFFLGTYRPRKRGPGPPLQT